VVSDLAISVINNKHSVIIKAILGCSLLKDWNIFLWHFIVMLVIFTDNKSSGIVQDWVNTTVFYQHVVVCWLRENVPVFNLVSLRVVIDYDSWDFNGNVNDSVQKFRWVDKWVQEGNVVYISSI